MRTIPEGDDAAPRALLEAAAAAADRTAATKIARGVDKEYAGLNIEL